MTRMLRLRSIVDEIRARRVLWWMKPGGTVVIRGDENGGQLEMFNKGVRNKLNCSLRKGGSILIKSHWKLAFEWKNPLLGKYTLGR